MSALPPVDRNGWSSPYGEDHEALRESFAVYLSREVKGTVFGNGDSDESLRHAFAVAGRHGFLALSVPEALGGAGIEDVRFAAAMVEEAVRADSLGFGLVLAVHNERCAPLVAALPPTAARDVAVAGLCEGRLIGMAAFDDLSPDPGSLPLRARRTTAGWAIDGTTSLAAGASSADLIVVAARSEEGGPILAILASDAEGFDLCAAHEPIGSSDRDGRRLVLRDVEVTQDWVLEEAADLIADHLADHRLLLAVSAHAGLRLALEQTLAYTRDRKAFGTPIASFENSRARLGEIFAMVLLDRILIDVCLRERSADRLDPALADAAKLRCAASYTRAADIGVQLHGGYGYMLEYPITQSYADAELLRLLGGSEEQTLLSLADVLGVPAVNSTNTKRQEMTDVSR